MAPPTTPTKGAASVSWLSNENRRATKLTTMDQRASAMAGPVTRLATTERLIVVICSQYRLGDWYATHSSSRVKRRAMERHSGSVSRLRFRPGSFQLEGLSQFTAPSPEAAATRGARGRGPTAVRRRGLRAKKSGTCEVRALAGALARVEARDADAEATSIIVSHARAGEADRLTRAGDADSTVSEWRTAGRLGALPGAGGEKLRF